MKALAIRLESGVYSVNVNEKIFFLMDNKGCRSIQNVDKYIRAYDERGGREIELHGKLLKLATGIAKDKKPNNVDWEKISTLLGKRCLTRTLRMLNNTFVNTGELK